MSAYIEIDNVKINNYTFPSADAGSGNFVISTDGSGNLSFTSIAGLISTFRESESITANKTQFTVTSGYVIGNLDVYYNGFKLLNGDDYTANDGSAFTLSESAVSGDIVEWVGIRYPQSHVSLSGVGTGRLFASDGSATSAVAQTGLIFTNNSLGINTISPSAVLDVDSNTIRLRSARTPASSSSSGNIGDICWDADNLYICVNNNTWKKSPLSSW
jgi:hypothetical protein